MLNPFNLRGLRVLNTRPQGQSFALNESITKMGGHAISCPTLTITPMPTATWLPLLPPLGAVRYAIFTSANAVHCFFDGLKNQAITWQNQLITFAIGRATAQALKSHHIPVHFVPEIADSEHLLALPALQAIKNHLLLLIKGEGGRTLIQETVTARGGILSIIEVYRRSIPQSSKDEYARLWQNDAIDIIVFTSQEAMRNLFILLGEQAKNWLQQKPCVVISPRLGEAASLLGIKNITVCQPDTLIDALHRFNQGYIDEKTRRSPRTNHRN